MENAPEVKKNGSLTVNNNRNGFEEPIQKEDLLIPRAKLLQALSPEIVAGESDPVTEKPFKSGLIINSLTKEVLPAGFIPVFKFTNWIRFNPRNSKDPNFDPLYGPGDAIWRSSNPLDPKVLEEGVFGPNGEAPKATKFLNFFCYFPGVDMPVVVSFSKTSFKAGKRLLSLAHFSGENMFARKYKLMAKQEVGEAGPYFVLTVDPAGHVSDEEYKAGLYLWENYHTKPIQVHEETAEDTTSAE